MALKSLESDLPKKPRDCNSRKLDLSQWWLSCRSSQRTWKLPQKAGQNERSSCLTLNKCERKPGKCHIVVMRSGILIVQKLRKQLWWSWILKITCVLPFGHPPAGAKSLFWNNKLHIILYIYILFRQTYHWISSWVFRTKPQWTEHRSFAAAVWWLVVLRLLWTLAP